MHRMLISSAIFVAVAFASASATIINIPDDYPTIQQGINASTDGDTVLVQPGTYVENVNFNGHNIVLGSLFLTTADTSYISQTIIDGDSSGSVVTFENGEDSTALIIGFTIQNGYSASGGGIYCGYSSPTITNNIIGQNILDQDGWSFGSGGGIYCSYSNPTITNNIISHNSADVESGSIRGGGIFCWESSPIITNNIISHNSADVEWGSAVGGGIYCLESNPVISNNIISGNSVMGNSEFDPYAIGYGGGINCDNSNPTIFNNLINENSANGRGGAIHCSGNSNPTINYNTISGNSAAHYGGGISCSRSNPTIMGNSITGNSAILRGGGILCYESNPIIMNNCFTRNIAYFSGGGIYCELVSNPLITNTIFWADSASYSPEIDFDDSSSPYFTYCDIQGGWAGEGNIDIDPLFRDPENGDFHLMADSCGDVYNSPCIDAGDPAIFDSMHGCDWGLEELRSDMGAYGGEGIPTDVDEEQIPEIPMQFLLSQNYPNPFNAFTVIQYNLPEASDVNIEIYDLLGRRVETLIQTEQQAGHHQVTWDAKNTSSGMYFYKIQAGEYDETRKMVLLR